MAQDVDPTLTFSEPLPHRLSRATRIAVGLLGALTFAGGVVAVFVVDGGGGAGAAALLATGSLALALAAGGLVPSNIKLGGVEVALPDRVRSLAAEAKRQGRSDVARALEVSAELAATAEPFTRVYSSVRAIAPSGAERTEALDALVRMVEKQAAEGRWSPAEARRLFESDEEGARIFALAMFRALPTAEDVDLAEKATFEPKSAFEQWHGLFVLERMAPHLPEGEAKRLCRRLDGLALPPEGDRGRQRRRLLQLLERRD